jgi:O-antigen/teichoic acid export membrane protein
LEATSPGSGVTFAHRVLPAAVALGAAAGLVSLFGAGLLGALFPRFSELPLLLQILAPLPAAIAIYSLGADLQSAQGRQVARLGVVIGTLGLGMLGCWLGALAGGLVGASIARLAALVLACVLTWGLRSGACPASSRG